jgi:hypothetical protein
MREKKNAYRVVMSKPERHRPLGRPRHKWENSIHVDLKEQEASYKHGNEPSSPIQCRKLLD